MTCGNGNGQGCGSRRSGSFALDTLELAADFHKTGEPRFGTELRNREKVLGTTLDYLRGLRIRYVEAREPTCGSGEHCGLPRPVSVP